MTVHTVADQSPLITHRINVPYEEEASALLLADDHPSLSGPAGNNAALGNLQKKPTVLECVLEASTKSVHSEKGREEVKVHQQRDG